MSRIALLHFSMIHSKQEVLTNFKNVKGDELKERFKATGIIKRNAQFDWTRERPIKIEYANT